MVQLPIVKSRMTKAIRRCAKLAGHIYEIDLSKISVIYDEKPGRIAEASVERGGKNPTINVNLHALLVQPDLVIREVAPHEVAHLVAFALERGKDWDHGPQWRRVCRSLGGEGSAYVGKRWEFTID